MLSTQQRNGGIHDVRTATPPPKICRKWELSFANETGRIFSGIGRNEDGQQRIKGTKKFFVIQFQDIPNTRINEVCYTSLLCQERPGKSDPNRKCITIFGTNVQYLGDVGTKTASLNLLKLVINSVISRAGDNRSIWHQQCLPQHHYEKSEYVKIQFS